MNTFPGAEKRWEWWEQVVFAASELRDAILRGDEVLLRKRDGGYRITGDLNLVSVAATQRVVIQGAVFEGTVDASDARFARSLDLAGCVFQQGLKLARAEVDGALVLAGARVAAGRGLTAPDLRVGGLLDAIELQLEGGDFTAPNARIAGDLRLCGAQLHGGLDLTYARIEGELLCKSTPEHRTEVNAKDKGFSVSLAGAKVKGQVVFKGALLIGPLNMEGVELESNLSCQSTKHHRTEINAKDKGSSVSLDGAKVKGYVAFDGALLSAALNLQRAEIEGGVFGTPVEGKRTEIGPGRHGYSVSLAGAKLMGPLNFANVKLAETLVLASAEIAVGVYCERAEIGTGRPGTQWEGISVEFIGANVKGSVKLSGARLAGALTVQSANIEANVWCNCDEEGHRTQIGAGKDGFSVTLLGAKVNGWVAFSGAQLDAALVMQGADIGGDVGCGCDEMHRTTIGAGADGTRWAGVSVSLMGAKVSGSVSFSGAALGGALKMGRSETGSLFFDRDASTGHTVEISGWVFLYGAHISGSCLWPEAHMTGGFDGQGLVVTGFFSAVKLKTGGGLDLSNAKVADYLDLSGATVAGLLDLSHAQVSGDWHTGPVRKDWQKLTVLPTHFGGGMNLERAELGGNWLAADCTIGSPEHEGPRRIEKLPTLMAAMRDRLEENRRLPHVPGAEKQAEKRRRMLSAWEERLKRLEEKPVLDLRHAEFKGRIQFNASAIPGSLSRINGTVNAQNVKVSGDLQLQHVHVRGSLVLEDANIHGELNLNGSVVGANLNLRSATVRGQLFGPLEEQGSSPQVHGEVRMDSATLAEVKLRLHGPGCHPEKCPKVSQVTPLLVSLEHAKVDRLVVGGALPTTEKPHFKLAGLEFKDLDVRELEDGPVVKGRRSVFRWLERSQFEILLAEMKDFDEEPYHQMEKWLRGRGRDDDADHVYLAMRRRELQLHPLTVWQRTYRRCTGREKLVLHPAPKSLCRWLVCCPLVPHCSLLSRMRWERRSDGSIDYLSSLRPRYDRPPMRMGWLRWLVNWFLLRTVGFGVRTRTATIAGILAFLFSWLFVFNTPESAEFKGTRRIDSLPERVFTERAAEWGRTNRLAETNLVVMTNAAGLVTTNQVITHTRIPGTNDIKTNAAGLRRAFEDEPSVLNIGAKQVTEWTHTDAFWLAVQIHVPLIHLMARDQYQPSDHPATFGHARTNRAEPPAERWQMLPFHKVAALAEEPPLKVVAPAKEPHGWALDFESYAALMQLLSYIFVPLIIASATGFLKKH